MKTYYITGGMSGYVNASADETTLVDEFEHQATTLKEAMDIAKALTRQIQPGGQVVLKYEDKDRENWFDLDEIELVAMAKRYVEGEWWIYPKGVDLTK